MSNFKCSCKMLLVCALTVTAPARADQPTGPHKIFDGVRARGESVDRVLAWAGAKAYLAELEKNEAALKVLGVPDGPSDQRTGYLAGVGALDLGIITGLGVYIAQILGRNARGHRLMTTGSPELFASANHAYDLHLQSVNRAARLGRISSEERRAIWRESRWAMRHNRKSYLAYQRKYGHTPLRRFARGVAVTVGVGLVLTFIFDGVSTWLQVNNNHLTLAQQKQSLREYIADTERDLGGERSDAEAPNP